jgi:hypothetical protein
MLAVVGCALLHCRAQRCFALKPVVVHLAGHLDADEKLVKPEL